jgi:hypothetical protein
MNTMSWQYIAGLVDGEGCIQLIKAKKFWYPSISISQKNQSFLQLLKQEIGFGGVYGNNFTVANRNASKFLEFTLPYLVIKRSEAELLNHALLILKHKSRRYYQPAIEKELVEISEELKICHLK